MKQPIFWGDPRPHSDVRKLQLERITAAYQEQGFYHHTNWQLLFGFVSTYMKGAKW